MQNDSTRFLSALFVAGWFVVAPLAANAQAPMPQQKMQGSLAYLNGGAGDEEVQFIKQAMKDYSLALAFAQKAGPRGEYVAEVAVTIKDAKGQTVFELPSTGPYLLVKLPPGSYEVTATYQGNAKTQKVSAGSGGASLVTLEWS